MRLSKLLLSAAAATILAASAPAAHADIYLYNFVIPGTPAPDNFAMNVSFDESSIFTTGTTIEPGSFLPGSILGQSIGLYIDPTEDSCADLGPGSPPCAIVIQHFPGVPDGEGGAIFEFNTQPTSTGTFEGRFGDPTLTITDLSTTTTVTPEPSSLILLGTGLLTAIGAARRRLI